VNEIHLFTRPQTNEELSDDTEVGPLPSVILRSYRATERTEASGTHLSLVIFSGSAHFLATRSVHIFEGSPNSQIRSSDIAGPSFAGTDQGPGVGPAEKPSPGHPLPLGDGRLWRVKSVPRCASALIFRARPDENTIVRIW